MIKLSSNENPFGASEKVLQTLKQFDIPHLYPDAAARALKEAIARKFSLNPDLILCGCGSEDLLYNAIQSLAQKGDEVVIPKHGFCIYEIATKRCGAIPIYVNYNKDMTLDVVDLLQKISLKTKVICLDNPGNPVGTYLPAADLYSLLKQIPPSVAVILDAAYGEYMIRQNEKEAKIIDYHDGLSWVEKEFSNLIVTRTFSKAYGIAGLRIGWLYTSASLYQQLSQNRILYKTTSIAQKAAIAALEDWEFVLKTVQHNQEWLFKLHQFLKKQDLYCFESFGNFIVCQFESSQKARQYVDFLSNRQIQVLSLATPYGLDHCVRVSIGTDRMMEHWMELTESFLAQSKKI